MMRSQEDWRRRVVTSVGRDMREERWTDLILYSSEGIPIPVHRAILSQSPHLRPLLTSLSCCQGRCANQEPLSLLLPEVSYELLLPAVTFLYTGRVQTRQQDRQALGELLELLGLGTIQIDVREPEPHTEEQEDLETSTVEHNIETNTLEENMETDNMEEENEEDGDKSSTTSHSGGITSSESEAEEDEFDETFNGGGRRGELEVGGDEIQTYQVVWARYRGWPWWPGVVSPATRRRGRTLLRRVEYFGCDDRGRNTHSELGKKNIKPFRGKEEAAEYQPEVERMYSSWGGQLEAWQASVEAAVDALKVPAEERLQNMNQDQE